MTTINAITVLLCQTL